MHAVAIFWHRIRIGSLFYEGANKSLIVSLPDVNFLPAFITVCLFFASPQFID